jgi:hypothetical protein
VRIAKKFASIPFSWATFGSPNTALIAPPSLPSMQCVNGSIACAFASTMGSNDQRRRLDLAPHRRALLKFKMAQRPDRDTATNQRFTSAHAHVGLGGMGIGFHGFDGALASVLQGRVTTSAVLLKCHK